MRCSPIRRRWPTYCWRCERARVPPIATSSRGQSGRRTATESVEFDGLPDSDATTEASHAGMQDQRLQKSIAGSLTTAQPKTQDQTQCPPPYC